MKTVYWHRYCRVNTNAIRLRAFLDNVFCFIANQIQMVILYGTINDKTGHLCGVFFIIEFLLMKTICSVLAIERAPEHCSARRIVYGLRKCL